MKSWASVVSGKESNASSQLETYPSLVDDLGKTMETRDNQSFSKKRNVRSYQRRSSERKKHNLPKPKSNEETDSHENYFAERLENEKRRYMQKFKQEKDLLCFQVINGDLFSTDADVSLAHCVSEDFKMSKGIAKEFKKRFGKVDELIKQQVKFGGCAFIKSENRHLFYLVTKKLYYHKPYYSSVEKSLKKLCNLCLKLNVVNLAMPMIGSGLDRLEWNLVSRIIDNIFSKSEISLSIYKYNGNNDSNQNQEKIF